MTVRKRAAALDAALSAMFRTLEARRAPDHLRETLDQLDRSEPAAPVRRKVA
jgi:hypothetical protein